MKLINQAAILSMQCGVVPMIYGDPGVAKTAIFRHIARHFQRHFLQVILRQKQPEDVGGIPCPTDIELPNGKIVKGVEYLLSREFLTIKHCESLVLWDEFNQCGKDMEGSVQEILNEPPSNCWMACVSNPVHKSTAGRQLAPPVVNRMLVTQWEDPSESWEEGMRNTGGDSFPLPEFLAVPERSEWADTRITWANLVCDFVMGVRPDLRHKFPGDPLEACKPWPSIRSWKNLSQVCAANSVVGGGLKVQADIIYGCVGEGAGAEFMEWLSVGDLPSGQEVLENPYLIMAANLKRFDQYAAVLGSALNELRDNTDPEIWESGLDLLDLVYKKQPEAAAQIYGAFLKAKPKGTVPRRRESPLKLLYSE